MKIAILTSGILPVPAVRGGAVENLIDFYLEYNDKHHLHDITIYSIADQATANHPALHSNANHYHYIDVSSPIAKVRKRLFHIFNRHNEYYHYTIEYYLNQAIKDIHRQSYDIIILENRPAYAIKLKEVAEAQLVYHLHNDKLSGSTPKYQEIYDAASGIITVSNYIKFCVQTINPNDTKTVTIYNGIDTKKFSRKEKSIISRKHLGISSEDFLMVFSGRINKDKGVEELIGAMTLLQDIPQIKLLVIGSTFFGNSSDEDDFVHSLKTKAESIQERIIFTGFVPYEKMPDYLQLADIAVIPSIWNDPFPTTVLEAQAMGLPIITTKRGGIPEEVTNKNAVLLSVDERLTENLAISIRNLYADSMKRSIMSAASIEHSKAFDKETYAKHFFEAIKHF
jgi:glycosyltransferase involved in cell wall biosynthesis